MELGNSITIIALRAAVRLAWGIARAARALGDLGVAMEGAVERQAHRTVARAPQTNTSTTMRMRERRGSGGYAGRFPAATTESSALVCALSLTLRI